MTQTADEHLVVKDPSRSESSSISSRSAANQPPVRLIRWPELQLKIGGRSLTAVTRAEKAGQFPKRVRQGNQISWIEHEVDEYLLSLPRGTRDREV